MTEHKVGTREEWLAARNELLERENEHAERSEELARQRQELPWVPVETEYTFETEDGKKTLAELFYAPTDPGQDPRHVGTLEPVWNLFDLTPEGRPPNWDEQLSY